MFFRAKEWEDAVRVLSGMVGVSGIQIHPILQNKLSFLANHGVVFAPYEAIHLPALDTLWFVFAFIIVLFFKNSMQKKEVFKLDYKTALFAAFFFAAGVLSLNKVSEFLYFNF